MCCLSCSGLLGLLLLMGFLKVRCCVISVSPIINEQIHRYKKCLVVVRWNNNFSCVLFHLFELVWCPWIVVAHGFLKVTLLCYSFLLNTTLTGPSLQRVFSSCNRDKTISSRVSSSVLLLLYPESRHAEVIVYIASGLVLARQGFKRQRWRIDYVEAALQQSREQCRGDMGLFTNHEDQHVIDTPSPINIIL